MTIKVKVINTGETEGFEISLPSDQGAVKFQLPCNFDIKPGAIIMIKVAQDARPVIDISEVFAIDARRREINGIPLSQAKFVFRGKEIEISQKVIEDFELRGLTAFDFFTCGFWLQGVDFSALPERE